MSPMPTLASEKRLEERPRLAELTETAISSCAAEGLSVTCLGIADQLAAPVGASAQTDWIVLPAEQDPLVKNGEMAIPAAQRRKLSRLAAADIELADLYLAHELPAGSLGIKPGGYRPLDKVAALRFEKAAKLPEHQGTKRLSHRLGTVAERAASMIGQSVGTALAAPLLLAAALDPVVLGIVTETGEPQPGQPAGWLVLVEWDW